MRSLALPAARPIKGDAPSERTPEVCDRNVRRLDPAAIGDFIRLAPGRGDPQFTLAVYRAAARNGPPARGHGDFTLGPIAAPWPTRVAGSAKAGHNVSLACGLVNAIAVSRGRPVMTEGRRELRFNSLDEVMPDVERLLAGHSTVGHWSLAQMCHHLATVMRRVVDMPASTPADPSQWAPEERKREVLDSGLLPEGLPTLPQLVPDESLEVREEAENLRAAIAHYKASSGPVVPHRIFGPLTKAEWDRVQCIHCAHHLSFAVPADSR